jgi:hypothetical protein
MTGNRQPWAVHRVGVESGPLRTADRGDQVGRRVRREFLQRPGLSNVELVQCQLGNSPPPLTLGSQLPCQRAVQARPVHGDESLGHRISHAPDGRSCTWSCRDSAADMGGAPCASASRSSWRNLVAVARCSTFGRS